MIISQSTKNEISEYIEYMYESIEWLGYTIISLCKDKTRTKISKNYLTDTKIKIIKN
jgi:hypothetical protein